MMRAASGMNWYIAILLLFLGVTVSGVTAATLRWDDPNKAGTVRGYNVYRNGPLPAETPLKDPIQTASAELDALQIFAGAVSGRYLVSVSCVGTSNVEGDKSASIVVNWDLRTRTARQEQTPEMLNRGAAAGCDKPGAKHETQGVVAQIFKDKAHSYVATRFQAVPGGSNGVCRVELDFKKFHEPKGNLTVYVWGDYRGKPAALIATSSSKIAASSATNEWCSAAISFRPVAGESYWIGASSTMPDANNNFLWFGGGPGMRCHSADGKVWVFSASEGMNFRFFE